MCLCLSRVIVCHEQTDIDSCHTVRCNPHLSMFSALLSFLVNERALASLFLHFFLQKSAGGVVTVNSELGEPIHKLSTCDMTIWKEIDEKFLLLPPIESRRIDITCYARCVTNVSAFSSDLRRNSRNSRAKGTSSPSRRRSCVTRRRCFRLWACSRSLFDGGRSFDFHCGRGLLHVRLLAPAHTVQGHQLRSIY